MPNRARQRGNHRANVMDSAKKRSRPRACPHRIADLGYALKQLDRLVVYLEDGRLRPDNNLAEHAIRSFAVGRKNGLFSGHPRGADASAAIYSLIETAKANGLEPCRYLRRLFQHLPATTTDVQRKALLPQLIDPKSLIIPA